MPLPWSKSKVSRFSRIVKDFQDLQSPKRCNSLVVETGFPTSLVDLFVKNRDRLKKSKKQKKKKQKQEVVEELVITDAIPLAGLRDPADHVCADNEIDDLRVDDFLEVQELVSELTVQENMVVVDGDNDDIGRGRAERGKPLMLVFLNMFVLVALGLSTKRVAVGITMSAFLLILMEYVGKHILCFLKPCSKARLLLDPFALKICSFLLALKRLKSWEGSRKLGFVIPEGGDSADGGSSIAVKTIELNHPVEEIKGVQSSTVMTSQVEENRRNDVPDCDKMWEGSDTGTKLGTGEEDERRSGGLVSEKESGKTGKTKRKIIKKLQNKLFSRKKGKNGKEKESDMSSEASSCLGEDKPAKGQVAEKGQDGDRGDFKKVISLTPQLIEGEERRSKGNTGGKEESHSISSACTKLHTKKQMTVTKENAEVDRKGSSHYVIVLVVVLAGLVGGRIVALLLTVACCLILKLFGRCRRHVNGLMNISPPWSESRVLVRILFKRFF